MGSRRALCIYAVVTAIVAGASTAAEARPPLLKARQANALARQALDQYYGWEWREASSRWVEPIYRMARNKYQVTYSFDVPDFDSWREGSVVIHKTWDGVYYRVLPTYRSGRATLARFWVRCPPVAEYQPEILSHRVPCDVARRIIGLAYSKGQYGPSLGGGVVSHGFRCRLSKHYGAGVSRPLVCRRGVKRLKSAMP